MTKGRMEAQRHELLTDVTDQIKLILSDYGIDGDIADQAGHGVANHLAFHWGGQNVTFPKDYKFELAKRDIEIWDKFDGRNYAKLAREFGLTTRAIYKIIDRVKDRQMKLAQPGFFDNMEDS